MNVGVKLTAFAAVTATVFGLAFGVGSVLDPIAPDDEVGLAMADGSDGDEHDGMDMGDSRTQQSPVPASDGGSEAAATIGA